MYTVKSHLTTFKELVIGYLFDYFFFIICIYLFTVEFFIGPYTPTVCVRNLKVEFYIKSTLMLLIEVSKVFIFMFYYTRSGFFFCLFKHDKPLRIFLNHYVFLREKRSLGIFFAGLSIRANYYCKFSNNNLPVDRDSNSFYSLVPFQSPSEWVIITIF